MNEKLLDKIRKLLRLAKSANEHEAALAAQRAQELLSKHNLSVHELGEDEVLHREAATRAFAKTAQRLDVWAHLLARGSAAAFDCGYCHGTSSGRTTFVGVGPDPDVCAYTFAFLYREIQRLGLRYLSEPRNRRLRAPGRKKARLAWSMGAVHTVVARLAEQKQSSPITPGALVPLKERAIATELSAMGVVTRDAKPLNLAGDHYVNGRIDARAIALRKALA